HFLGIFLFFFHHIIFILPSLFSAFAKASISSFFTYITYLDVLLETKFEAIQQRRFTAIFIISCKL
ncbi:hypothetical protein KSS87_019772, partial [Heliosperma pusillum]